MRHFILSAAFISFPLLVSAQKTFFQPGYIVRSEAPSDTLRGYIDLIHATQPIGRIRFQPAPDATVEVLRPAQLLAAGTTNQRQAFRTKTVEGEPRFLEIITTGQLTLYTGYYSQSKVDFMLEQEGGSLLPLPRTQYATLLPAVAAPCPTTPTTPARLQYSRAPLGRFVEKANKCHTTAGRYFPGAKGQPIKVGVRAGIQHNQFWFVYNDHPFGFKKPDASVGFTGAVQAVLPVAGGFKAVVEGAYSQASSTVAVRDLPGAAINYYNRSVDLDAKMLQVPLLLRWQFGRDERRIHPYVEGGGGVNFVLQSRSWYEALPEESYDKPESYEIGINKTNFFVRGGAGISYRTPLGSFALSAHTQRMSLSSSRELSSYRLNQMDVSLSYFW